MINYKEYNNNVYKFSYIIYRFYWIIYSLQTDYISKHEYISLLEQIMLSLEINSMIFLNIIVHSQNIRQGAYIVRKCYTALVSWLEDAMKENRKIFKEKSNFKEFQQAYQLALDRAKPQETMTGGYVLKKNVLAEASKILKVSPASTYRKFEKIKNFSHIST